MEFFGILLILFLLAVAPVVFWLGSLALFIVGRKRQSRLQSWLGGAAFALVSGAGLWFIYLCAFPPPSDSTNVYRAAFEAPSRDVTALQSSEDGFRDWSSAHLKFRAAPQTIERITAPGWRPIAAKDWKDVGAFSRDEEAPKWWRPQSSPTTRVFYFYATKRLGHYSNMEDETLIYDAATHQAYYSYNGVD